MAWNTGMIAGQVYLGDWVTGAGPDFFVTLQYLRLGDKRFTILDPETEQKKLHPQVYTGEDGYFLIPFLWYPEHVGEIDQPLRAKISVRYAAAGDWNRETAHCDVGLYVSFGAIYKGMGGPMLPADGFADWVSYWTDVYAAIRKIEVPRILTQTGWMSPEAYGLLGDVFVKLPSYAST